MNRTFAISTIAVTAWFAAAELRAAPPRLLRPPLWVDPDDRDIPEPAERRVSEIWDKVRNTWFRHLDPAYLGLRHSHRPALNVNAWDEVPDSTWFTNRIGRKPLGREELIGGIPGLPPEPSPWRVWRLSREGYTPKFYIRDEAGRRFVLKFDLPQGPERNSAAERMGTLIMFGAGYNVPHNTIVWFRASDLTLDDKPTFEDPLGRTRPMTEIDLKEVLSGLPPGPDGRYRGLASHFLPPKLKGRFAYLGTRPDDPNDLIPHELRRELRGLRVIGAWFNHVDTKEVNNMDSYVTEGGRRFIRHYFLDFGSSFGSGDFINGPRRVGHEYIFDGPAMGRALISLGAWQRPWEVSCREVYPEVGHYEADLFEAASWKPNYPNLAFEEMDEADGYWGAKIVSGFSDDLIRTLTEEARYTRPEVTRYMEETLRRRRDKIGGYWFDRIAPLEGFELEKQGESWRLRFRDLAIERGYVSADDRAYGFEIKDPRCLSRIRAGSSREGASVTLGRWPGVKAGSKDRWGRTPLLVVDVWTSRRDGGRARPVRVVIGEDGQDPEPHVLGWEHAPRDPERQLGECRVEEEEERPL